MVPIPQHSNTSLFGLPLAILPVLVQFLITSLGYLIADSSILLTSIIDYSPNEIITIFTSLNLFGMCFVTALKKLRPYTKTQCPLSNYIAMSVSFLVYSISSLVTTSVCKHSYCYLLQALQSMVLFLILLTSQRKYFFFTKLMMIMVLVMCYISVLYLLLQINADINHVLSIVLFGCQSVSLLIFFKIIAFIYSEYAPSNLEIVCNFFTLSFCFSLPIFGISCIFGENYVDLSLRAFSIGYALSNCLFLSFSFLLTHLKLFGFQSILTLKIFQTTFLILVVISYAAITNLM